MSLEQAIQENTAAVVALTAIIAGWHTPAASAIAPTQPEVKPTGTKPADQKPVQVDAEGKTVKPEAPKPAPESTPAALTYADVGHVVTAYVKIHGRDKTVAILKEFGLERLTEITTGERTPGQYAAIKARFEKEMA